MPPAARAALLLGIEEGPHAVALFDPDDRLAYGNQVFRRGWAVEDGDATFDSIIRNCHRTRRGAVIEADDIDLWLKRAARSRREGPARRAFEVDLWDGRWIWLTEHRLENGWILFIGQDITQLKQSERILRQARDAALRASLTDPLTHLPNRRSAMQTLEDRLEAGEPFHLALVDIDNFKVINDTHGHAAGDHVLVCFGESLLALAEQGYSVARLAGDEFAIISRQGEDADSFKAMLTALLEAQRDPLEHCGMTLTARVSIGAASFPANGSEARELLAVADAALYRVKFGGRGALRFA